MVDGHLEEGRRALLEEHDSERRGPRLPERPDGYFLRVR
jgi:hypothetical protein